jgi:CDP-diacylglycerol--glycerol-3-phosphate 3-phosphatidyltransferase/cardiolipin synthase
MVEASASLGERQAKAWGAADALTALRLPLAAAFVLVEDARWRFLVLALAAGSDLLDGLIARRFGPSRLGVFLDPVADKLFMAAAFWVVLVSGRLEPYEIVGVLLRDIVAAVAFVATLHGGRPSSIPARAGGKAVTLAQNLTLLAFVAGSELLRPMAWATAGIAMYAIWDYAQARGARRPVGT